MLGEGLALLFEERLEVWSGPGRRVLFASPVADDWMRLARDGGLEGLAGFLESELGGFPRMFGLSVI